MEDEYYNDDEYIYEENEYIIRDTDNAFSRSLSYQVIKTIDLNKLRDQIIKEAMEYLCLSRDETTTVLINYQWNMEKIRDQWYENVDENKIKCGIELSQKNLDFFIKGKIESNSNYCLVCYSDLNNEDSFSLLCKHNFCKDCWTDHLNSKTEDILIMVSTTCPQQGCPLIVPETFFRKYLSMDSQEILNKAILKNFTDNNSDLKWCPTPNCGVCIQCVNHNSKEIECDCKAVFCFTCGKDAHRPCTCEMIQAWDAKNSSQSENVKWLTANTKQCPGCHKFIEKNQGCNHMTCRKEAGGCGYEFCWICFGEWKAHGGDFYNCNKFDPKKKTEDEKKMKKAKFDLDKYVFYFNRYMNHQKSLKYAINMRTTMQTTIKQFNETKHIPFEELRYLENAVEALIKSHRSLKSTYVFGFYMKEVNERGLFEHNQTLLEKEADSLHEKMEGDGLKQLLNIENKEEFDCKWNLFKSNVINLSSVTVKYLTNLINDIEMNLMEFVDYKNLHSN